VDRDHAGHRDRAQTLDVGAPDSLGGRAGHAGQDGTAGATLPGMRVDARFYA
jgi:hypothetical protein